MRNKKVFLKLPDFLPFDLYFVNKDRIDSKRIKLISYCGEYNADIEVGLFYKTNSNILRVENE